MFTLKRGNPAMDKSATLDAEILKAYKAYEEKQRIANTKIGCFLVVILMPAGSLLDLFVYPDKLGAFFILRLLCSACAAAIWIFLLSEARARGGRFLGVVVPLLPAIAIAGMI